MATSKTHELHLSAAAVRASEDGLTGAAHYAAHQAQRVAALRCITDQARLSRMATVCGHLSHVQRYAGAFLEISRFRPEATDLWTAYRQWLRLVLAECHVRGCDPRLSEDDLPATHPRIHEEVPSWI